MQVITTLQRAIDCTKRQAVDLATIVDREVSCHFFTPLNCKLQNKIMILVRCESLDALIF